MIGNKARTNKIIARIIAMRLAYLGYVLNSCAILFLANEIKKSAANKIAERINVVSKDQIIIYLRPA